MNRARPVAADLGQLAWMTPGMLSGTSASAGSLAAELAIVPGHLVYAHIPATSLRNCVDASFPGLAQNADADVVSGWHHRYKAGHDLLLDVPQTALSSGPWAGLSQAGHILLTDFPTKAGIPIPGFSQSGLGGMLEHAGIARGWLQMSVFDTGIGILALAEGSSTLQLALAGALQMDFGTACQTFGAGSVEIALAMSTQNPLLLAGGLHDVLAGVVSAWKTVSVYVDPLDFFGASATSTLLGFGLSYGLAGNSLSQAALDAARSGVVGALYSVSTGFGLGALAGFTAFRLGAGLAERHNREAQAMFAVDQASYELLIKVLCEADPSVATLLKAAQQAPRLPTHQANLWGADPASVLPSAPPRLPSGPPLLPSHVPQPSVAIRRLPSAKLTLPVDPPLLDSSYRAVFGKRQ